MTSLALQDALTAHKVYFAEHAEWARLFLPLLRLLAEGQPVAPERLATAWHRSPAEIPALLQTVEVEIDHDGNIVSNGLSLRPTPHQVHLGERTLYTWCALDTLALPALLGSPARVISTCPATGTQIHLTVTPTHIESLEPASAVVSARLPEADISLCHVREDVCVEGHFFASHEVASAWPSLHPQAVLLSVEEAAVLGRDIAHQLLTLEQEPYEQR